MCRFRSVLTGTDLCHQNTDSERPVPQELRSALPPVAENLPAGAGATGAGSVPGSERSLEWEMATHSTGREAWQPRIQWGLKSQGSTEARHVTSSQAPVYSPSPSLSRSLSGWAVRRTPGAVPATSLRLPLLLDVSFLCPCLLRPFT